jgi:hypothetical protein
MSVCEVNGLGCVHGMMGSADRIHCRGVRCSTWFGFECWRVVWGMDG